MALTLSKILLTIFAIWPVLAAAEEQALRVGHFPNITHAQGVIGHELTARGQGWFEPRIKNRVEWLVFNAGPSAMEALMTDTLDLTYVGPSPALNAFVRTRGSKLAIISGAARGGSGLVASKNLTSAAAKEFVGKKIATPQFGNTQDIAARYWAKQGGLAITQSGGDILILPTENPDSFSAFKRGEIDGVWSVEPWLSRLEVEADGKLLIDEGDVVTTVLVVSKSALKNKPELVKAFLAAHLELTDWLNREPLQAKEIFAAGFERITKKTIPTPILERAFSRIKFQTPLTVEEFSAFVTRAQSVGFMKEADPQLQGLIVSP